MAQCDTCKNEFTGEGPFCKLECHPGFGKGSRHPGTRRFPVARLHDGEVAERGVEDGSRVG